jgi:molecular chaperone Hsp33
MADHIVRCLLADLPVRVVAAVTTQVAQEAARRHGAVGGAQVALGRSATTGLLLATLTKGGEQVTVQILGDGPLGAVTVDATDAGDVRAYIKNPEILVTGGAGHRTRLVSGVGRHGIVNVVRDLGLKHRVTGQSPLVTGEIDEDVEHYLRTSEQIESALACEVVLADTADVRAAGGVLVQCMPDSDEVAIVHEVQQRLRSGEMYAALARDPVAAGDAVELARSVLGDAGDRLQVLDTRPVRFYCPCTSERVAGALRLLSEADLEAMVIEDDGAEVICNFCGQVYELSGDELDEIRQSRGVRATT